MQRMKLHLSGFKLSSLGSLHDRVIREYMSKESQLELARRKLEMLRTVHAPNITDAGKFREWSGVVKDVWNKIIELEFHVDLPDHSEEDSKLLDYYVKVVKNLKPKIHNDKSGPKVTGLDALNY